MWISIVILSIWNYWNPFEGPMDYCRILIDHDGNDMKWHPLQLWGQILSSHLSFEQGQDRPSIHWITADCRQLTEIPSDSFPLVVAGYQGYPSLWLVVWWCECDVYGCMLSTSRNAIDPYEGHNCTCWCFLVPLVDLIQLLYALRCVQWWLKHHLCCTCPMSSIQSLAWGTSSALNAALRTRALSMRFFALSSVEGRGHRLCNTDVSSRHSPHYLPTRQGHDQHVLAIMEFLKEDCLVRVMGTLIRTVPPCGLKLGRQSMALTLRQSAMCRDVPTPMDVVRGKLVKGPQ